MKGLFAAVAVVAAMVGSDASASDWNPETGAVYTACKLVEGKTNFTLYGQDLFLAGQCMGQSCQLPILLHGNVLLEVVITEIIAQI